MPKLIIRIDADLKKGEKGGLEITHEGGTLTDLGKDHFITGTVDLDLAQLTVVRHKASPG